MSIKRTIVTITVFVLLIVLSIVIVNACEAQEIAELTAAEKTIVIANRIKWDCLNKGMPCTPASPLQINYYRNLNAYLYVKKSGETAKGLPFNIPKGTESIIIKDSTHVYRDDIPYGTLDEAIWIIGDNLTSPIKEPQEYHQQKYESLIISLYLYMIWGI